MGPFFHMQHYIKITVEPLTTETAEMVMALLADAGYEGFVENDAQLEAYISEDRFDVTVPEQMLGGMGLTWTKEVIAPQNWNAIWESSFTPVIIPDFVAVRAAFHAPVTDVPYELVITPQMSFGTGHHATTLQMMQLMRHIDFHGKKVFDFGTGTGVLAILAEKLGAGSVLAMDNDEWSINNATDNVQNNRCSRVIVEAGDQPPVDQKFDVILANINRHILLEHMPAMAACLQPGGQLLISGFYADENPLLVDAAARHDLTLKESSVNNHWSALLFSQTSSTI